MKKTGYDHQNYYTYNEIKDYGLCCTCKYFFDNELETRFECEKETQNENCYESKFEN